MVINICLIIVIVLTLIILGGYNKLIRLSNCVKQSISDIDVILNQRFDLIPNIVSCIKKYSSYESDTLEKVVLARNTYKQSNIIDFKQAEEISSDINKIMALAEAYPDLKSNEQFMSLQCQLREIENKLEDKRIYYNHTVTRYNNAIETIPSNIIAKMFNFVPEKLFKLDENKKTDINLNF